MGTHAEHERLARIVAASGIAAVLALAGAWSDVLPGGWRLRGIVEAHATREARERARHAAERLQTFAAESPDESRGAVVFLGSSTIERCPLETLFPDVRAVNHGIGWAGARELAAHLDALLIGDPRAIVLYAGSPDRLAGPLDVEGVIGSIEHLARAVRARAPTAPVLLLGLLPSTTTRGAETEAFRRIEDGIGRIAVEFGFAHIDFTDTELVDAAGALRETLSVDGLHLSLEGYAIFAHRLRTAPEPFATLLAR